MEIYKHISDTLYWKNKYFPKCLDDLETNKNTINLITNWIKNYNKNKINHSSNKLDEIIDDIELEENDDNNIDELTYEKNINSPNKSCMIVTGNHGIGKTCTLITILKSLDYTIYQINFNKIDNFKNIDEFIEKPIFGNSISEKINNMKIKNKIILIDNLESILSIKNIYLIINTIN